MKMGDPPDSFVLDLLLSLGLEVGHHWKYPAVLKVHDILFVIIPLKKIA